MLLVLQAWDFMFFAGRKPSPSQGAPQCDASTEDTSAVAAADGSTALQCAARPAPRDFALGPSVLHFMALGLLLSRRDAILGSKPGRPTSSSGGEIIFAELPQIVSRLAIRSQKDLDDVISAAIRLRASTPWSVVASIERACYETAAPDPTLLHRLEKRHVVRITAAEALLRAAGPAHLSAAAGASASPSASATQAEGNIPSTAAGVESESESESESKSDPGSAAVTASGSGTNSGSELRSLPPYATAAHVSGSARAPRFLLLDCRPHAALADGLRIQGAVNLDPCLLESPEALSLALKGLRDLNRSNVHVAVMATGRSLAGRPGDSESEATPKEALTKNYERLAEGGGGGLYSSGEASKLMPLYLLQSGFERVSVVAGGFARVVGAYRSMEQGVRASLEVSLQGEGQAAPRGNSAIVHSGT